MKVFPYIKTFSNRLLDALFPSECAVCGRSLVEGERYVCLHCLADMPLLQIDSLTDNAVHATLASTLPIDKALSLFRYRRGSPFTRLIHQAKYSSRMSLALWLGRRLGTMCRDTGFLDDVDAVVPVPLNAWKKMRRGYNQSEVIALGLTEGTGVPVKDCLKARRHTTQTRKDALHRRLNASGVFSLRTNADLGRCNHIVLVDDVITTGSTILECAAAIRRRYPSMRVSVVSAALTEL